MAVSPFIVSIKGAVTRPRTPEFLADADRAYLERIALGDMVIRGEWQDLLIDLQRTLYRYREVENSQGVINRIITSPNYPKMACRAIADLLLYDEPVFSFGDDLRDGPGPTAQRWSLIERASQLPVALWGGVFTQQFRGGLAWYESVRLSDGRVAIVRRSAAESFIAGPLNHDKTPTMTERRVTLTRRSGLTRRSWLITERHTAGMIDTFAQEIIAGGKRLADVNTPLDQLFDEPPADHEETGVDRPLLTFIAGPMVGGVDGDCEADEIGGLTDSPFAQSHATWMSGGIGDDDFLALIDAVVFSYSNLVQAISRFGDPKVIGPRPEGETDGESPVKSTDDYYSLDEPEKLRYLEWNAQLDSAFKLFSKTVDALLIQTEINPRLVGVQTDSTAPDAWRKLLLESVTTQARIKRMSLFWGPGLERIAETALALTGVGSLFTPAPVTVRMRGGIPEPLPDLVDRLGMEIATGLTDEQTARETLHGAERAAVVTERVQAQRAEADQRQRAALFNAAPTFGASGGGGV